MQSSKNMITARCHALCHALCSCSPFQCHKLLVPMFGMRSLATTSTSRQDYTTILKPRLGFTLIFQLKSMSLYDYLDFISKP